MNNHFKNTHLFSVDKSHRWTTGLPTNSTTTHRSDPTSSSFAVAATQHSPLTCGTVLFSESPDTLLGTHLSVVQSLQHCHPLPVCLVILRNHLQPALTRSLLMLPQRGYKPALTSSWDSHGRSQRAQYLPAPAGRTVAFLCLFPSRPSGRWVIKCRRSFPVA